MLATLKLNVALITVNALIVSLFIFGSFSSMFGQHYKKSLDYSCCKGDQLVINHYYSVKIFWVDVATGYTLEPTGKAWPGGCNVKCN